MGDAMQAVILAGGKGTRMAPLTTHVPKCLLPVAGSPFIDHLLVKLRASGFREVILCVSHFGDQVRSWVKDGGRYGLDVSYSFDEGGGTQAAIDGVGHDRIRDTFLLTYGDTYLPFDYAAPLRLLQRQGLDRVATVWRNDDGAPPIKSNFYTPDGITWMFAPSDVRAKHVEAGALALRKVPTGELVLPYFLMGARPLEIGSHAGYAHAQSQLSPLSLTRSVDPCPEVSL